MSILPRPLLEQLVDDAAMFPPGNASAPAALSAHLRYRREWFSWLVGPLLIHADRWPEFVDAHTDIGAPAVDVVVIGATARPDPTPVSVRVVGFEVAVPHPPLPQTSSGIPLAAEVTAGEEGAEVLEEISRSRAAGVRVIGKYRTGGVVAEAFPDEQQLATVLDTALTRGAPLKLTAGLHHAVRRTDATTGFEQHGFLNVMVVVSRWLRDLGGGSLEDALATRDPAPLVDEVHTWSHDHVAAVRRGFVSFGCCGVEDPVNDLLALGLIDKENT
ncbi:MAG: hypothetical protein ACRDQA_14440 [Nocardioidaceae bacterium]